MIWFRRVCYFIAALCIACVLYYRIWFLRQPERHIPNNQHEFISPANGTVVSIRHWDEASVVETKADDGAIKVWTRDVDTAGYIVSIQMNVTNVHFQRAPVAAKLLSKTYTRGSFHNAVRMSNEYGIRFENEHNEMLFETAEGKKFKVIQIAGFLARRIEDYLSQNQDVAQGDVIGLIKLGSQVTVILPHDAEITAKVGETVTDGESVLARW